VYENTKGEKNIKNVHAKEKLAEVHNHGINYVINDLLYIYLYSL